MYTTLYDYKELLAIKKSKENIISTNSQSIISGENAYNSHFYSENVHINYEMDKIEEWYQIVDSMQFDMHRFSISISTTKTNDDLEKKFGYKTIKIFENVIIDYLEETKEKEFLKKPSDDALKNFLYILPSIEKYSPILSIDSSTGYVNSTFNTNDYGFLSALSTDKGEIHFSRVSEDHRIFKYSGIFKIKDKRDLKHINIMMRML